MREPTVPPLRVIATRVGARAGFAVGTASYGAARQERPPPPAAPEAIRSTVFGQHRTAHSFGTVVEPEVPAW